MLLNIVAEDEEEEEVQQEEELPAPEPERKKNAQVKRVVAKSDGAAKRPREEKGKGQGKGKGKDEKKLEPPKPKENEGLKKRKVEEPEKKPNPAAVKPRGNSVKNESDVLKKPTVSAKGKSNVSEAKKANVSAAPTTAKPPSSQRTESNNTTKLMSNKKEEPSEKHIKNKPAVKSAAPKRESTAVSSIVKAADNSDFTQLGLAPKLVELLLKPEDQGGMGFNLPTPVQRRSIPSIIQGRDVLIRSQTGSGKTLAFGLPILHLLSESSSSLSRGDGISALVLSPTRELCYQIAQVFEKVAKPFHWIIIGSLVGGEKRKSEKARLRKGINILVASPGRLLDHLDRTESLRTSLKRGKLRWLVLDEADRLTDSGFVKQISSVLDWLDENLGVDENGSGKKSFQSRLQTVLVSATLNSKVQELASRSLKDPDTIEVEKEEIRKHEQTSSAEKLEENSSDLEDDSEVGGTNLKERAEETENDLEISMPKSLTQHYMEIECKDRLVALSAFTLRQVKRYNHTVKIILFVSCRAVVDFLHAALSRLEWPPRKNPKDKPKNIGLGTRWWKLHGSIEQKERRRAIDEFGKAKNGVLICTDVAARGLDLPHVDWIVQYDPPSEFSEYVHRVGRTARSGRNGSSLLFLLPSEMDYVKYLENRSIKLVEMKVDPTFAALSKFALQEEEKEVAAETAEDELDRLLIGGGDRTKLRQSAKGKKGIASRALINGDAAAGLLHLKMRDIVEGSSPSKEGEDEEDNEGATVDNNEKGKKRERDGSGRKNRMKVLAEEAFVAFIRAYAVHSKETKEIFHPKKLHLGHVAKSFGLKEEPRGVSSVSRKRHKDRVERKTEKQNKRDFLKKAERLVSMSEFAS